MVNWIFLFKILIIISFIIIGIDIIIKGKITKKIGRNFTIGLMILIVISFIGIFFVKPIIVTKISIKKEIKNSKLNKYIVSYDLSGYKNSTITVKGDNSFLKLDDKTKFNYMNEVEKLVNNCILMNYNFHGNEDALMKLVKDNKVILKVDNKEYVTQYDTLDVNGKEVYVKPVNKVKHVDENINTPRLNTPKVSNRLTYDEENRVRVLTKKVVSDRLKVPSSAKFCGYNELKIQPSNDGTYIVNGWVEGENDFGGTVRNNFSVIFEREDGDLYASYVNLY